MEPFLERIFLQNAGLEPDESARSRARALAADRAPGLVEEYRSIGGSPLNEQADHQARALQTALRERNWDAHVYSTFQYTAPFMADGLEEARRDGVESLVVLPLYPICGQSTTRASLVDSVEALDGIDWTPDFAGVSGWHHHPDYVAMRVNHIRSFLRERDLDVGAPDTLLYFSVHGTPIRYLDEGNRYDRYVEEQCREIANRLGADRHAVGFQNHTNRRVVWTQPDNEDRIRSVSERRLVVVPISFMHEQSETLAELDHELRDFAEGLGKEFHRVPVPHDDPAFITFLADLTERLVLDRAGDGDGTAAEAGPTLSVCRCVPIPGVRCTNGHRDLPPSPYVPARNDPG